MTQPSQANSATFDDALKTLRKNSGNAFFSSGLNGERQKQIVFNDPIELHQLWYKSNSWYNSQGEVIDLDALIILVTDKAKKHSKSIAGFLSYEAMHQHFNIESKKPAITDLPDLQIGIYNSTHEYNLTGEFDTQLDRFELSTPFTASETEQRYADSIRCIQDYIQSGDCYQINYAQHFSAEFSGSVLSAFLSLVQHFNAPYGCYFDTDFGEICSLSPEQFIEVRDGNISTQPIKGSAARSNDAEVDKLSAETLKASEKDLAENLMIVDLLRNDLGKVCEAGSVTTPKLFELQSFTNVHHLVSTVSGKLQQDVSPLQAMFSCFPGGSITGAPKRRAMEIIEELESARRSVYCGSAFYQLANGDFDSNIMIRTLASHKNTLHCWGGGGIVADSQSESEYQESIFKVKAFMRHLENMR